MIRQAGEAELHTKMMDPDTGEIIVAIIDKRETRDRVQMFQTNRVRNQYEFARVYRNWAESWLASLNQKS